MSRISSVAISCLKELKVITSSDDLNVYSADVPQTLWQDELGRLRVWAANIGAHQVGQSSLDHRLRDASHIKDQTLRVLRRLQRLIQDLQDALQMESVSEDFSDSEDEAGEKSEVLIIYQDLHDTISNLFQLSMIIRKPAQHDRLWGTKRSDAAGFEPFDRQHVLNKYPQAEASVLDCLGLAISQRRAILRYRERHHIKLGKGLGQAIEDQSDAVSTNISDTVATSFIEKPTTHVEFDSQSFISQTSYAQTLLSGEEGMVLPPPPTEADNGTPFECPYCFVIISISGEKAWARHVFNDLMPYICVFSDCSTPHRLYESRREWYFHLHNQHAVPNDPGSYFNCPLCSSPVGTGKQFERHVARHLEELALFALPRSQPEVNASQSDRESTREMMFDTDSDSDQDSLQRVHEYTNEQFNLDGESPGIVPASLGSPVIDKVISDSIAPDEEEIYTIKCICLFSDDDGNTVYCEKCETWQHIVCYYPDKRVPDVHNCVDCKPRPLDARRAAKHQHERRIRERSVKNDREKRSRGDEPMDTSDDGDITSFSNTPGVPSLVLNPSNPSNIRKVSKGWFEMPFTMFCTTCKPHSRIGRGTRFLAEQETLHARVHSERQGVNDQDESPNYRWLMQHSACGGWIEIRANSDDPIPKGKYTIIAGGYAMTEPISGEPPRRSFTKENPTRHIIFIDPMKNQFEFPVEQCSTWQGLNDTIRIHLQYAPDILAEFEAARYDIVDEADSVIFPDGWSTVVEAGVRIKMRIWPTPQYNRKSSRGKVKPVQPREHISTVSSSLEEDRQTKPESRRARIAKLLSSAANYLRDASSGSEDERLGSSPFGQRAINHFPVVPGEEERNHLLSRAANTSRQMPDDDEDSVITHRYKLERPGNDS